MSDNTINEIAKTSPDMHKERIEQLKALLPDLFDGEGQLDETALRTLISNEAGDAAQRFSFEWAGKQKSKRLAYTPSRASLAYDPTRSLNHDGTENKKGQTAEQNTSENLIIEGDNLEVLKLLQTTYFEQVKCIYIDPPYNTGKDFIYPDNFTEGKKAYWEKNGEVKEGVKLTALPETHGRRHSDWLNFMQSRLLLARQMLREDGVIFVSIDDNEQANLKRICDEIFGSENFVNTVVWEKRYSPQNAVKWFSEAHDFVLVYAKDKLSWYPKLLGRTDTMNARYQNFDDDPRGDWKPADATAQAGHGTKSQFYELTAPNGSKHSLPNGRCWVYTEDVFQKMVTDNRIWFGANGNNVPAVKRFISEVKQGTACQTIWKYNEVGHNQEGKKEVNKLFPEAAVFDTPKPVRLLKRVMHLATEANSIVLDFFAGSGTSAHAIMQQNAEDGGNRKHIMVQIPEFTDEKSEAYKTGYKVISDITIERVKRSGAKIREENPDAKIDTGFRVFKLTHSNFAENLFTPDEDKSDAENMKALETHLTEATQMRLFDADEFNNLVTEISLKNGFGLFYQLEAMTEFEHNKIYRLHGNDKNALLCLDNSLHDNSVENLKTFKEEQLIVSSSALDTSKKFSLKTKFKGNLRVF